MLETRHQFRESLREVEQRTLGGLDMVVQIDGMKQYRDEVRAHAVRFGRDPDDIKVLYLVYPILGETS